MQSGEQHQLWCGCLQYYDGGLGACQLRPSFIFLWFIGALGLAAFIRDRCFSATAAEKRPIASAGGDRSELTTSSGFWQQLAERWQVFWEGDFADYGHADVTKAVFLWAVLLCAVWAGRVGNVPFGDSPLAAPDMLAAAPPEFWDWEYPASMFTAALSSSSMLYALRGFLLVVWVLAIVLLLAAPKSKSLTVSLVLVASILFYFNGVVQAFLGQNHRFFVPTWCTAALALGHCSGDGGAWLRKFTLMLMCYTYFAAGVAKAWNGGFAWWRGDVLHWYIAHFGAGAQETHRVAYFSDFLMSSPWALCFSAVGAGLWELLIPLILLPSAAKLRPLGYLSILMFHTVIYVTMGIIYIPQCVCLLLVVDLSATHAGPASRASGPGSACRLAVTALLLVAMTACIALRAEAWPLSNIPMYSTLHRADPTSMAYHSAADFLLEAKQVGSAASQVGVGLGRSSLVTIADSAGRSVQLRSLADYNLLLPCAGLKFKWYAYLSRAIGQQVLALQRRHEASQDASSPLDHLLLHFSPWLQRGLDSGCEGDVTISVQPLLSGERSEDPLVLGMVRVPCKAAAQESGNSFVGMLRSTVRVQRSK